MHLRYSRLSTIPREYGLVEDIGFVMGSGQKLFWSYRQNDSGPHKENDYNKIKLSDEFRVHRISFPQEHQYGLRFSSIWCMENIVVN
jgi:hypothetical protein